MRKTTIFLLVIIATMIAISVCKAQDTTRQKVQYKKFVKAEITDIKFMIQVIDDYKRLIVYDPVLTAEQKISVSQQMQSYVIEVQKRFPIDSVAILSDSVKSKPVLKKPKRK